MPQTFPPWPNRLLDGWKKSERREIAVYCYPAMLILDSIRSSLIPPPHKGALRDTT